MCEALPSGACSMGEKMCIKIYLYAYWYILISLSYVHEMMALDLGLKE